MVLSMIVIFYKYGFSKHQSVSLHCLPSHRTRGHWNQNLGRLPAPGGWTKTTSRGGEAVGAGAAAVRRRAPGPGVPGQRGRGPARGPALPQQLGVEVGVALGVFTETKIFIH